MAPMVYISMFDRSPTELIQGFLQAKPFFLSDSEMLQWSMYGSGPSGTQGHQCQLSTVFDPVMKEDLLREYKKVCIHFGHSKRFSPESEISHWGAGSSDSWKRPTPKPLPLASILLTMIRSMRSWYREIGQN